MSGDENSQSGITVIGGRFQFRGYGDVNLVMQEVLPLYMETMLKGFALCHFYVEMLHSDAFLNTDCKFKGPCVTQQKPQKLPKHFRTVHLATFIKTSTI